jgi:DNA topoisomerase-1
MEKTPTKKINSNTNNINSNSNSKTNNNKVLEEMKSKNSKFAKILTTTSFSDLIQVNKWWEMQVEDFDSETKWKKMEHNGLLMAPKYEPHGVKILYKGEKIELKPFQEELATFWAGLANNDLAEKKITRNNFLREFKAVLDNTYKDANLEDFDFTPIINHIENQREKNRNRTNEEKKV